MHFKYWTKKLCYSCTAIYGQNRK